MQQMIFGIFTPLLYVLLVPANSYNLDERYFWKLKEKPNQYFGFSIGFRKHQNKYKIIVGSPKTNYTDIASGAIYECSFQENANCVPIDLKIQASTTISMENQWLGVALDISPHNSHITVCAHRRKKHLIYFDSLGACYEIADTFGTSLPKFFELDDFNANYGTSCRYSKGGDLLIGIPGKRHFGSPSYGGYYYKNDIHHNDRKDYYEGYKVTYMDEQPVVGKPKFDNYGAVRVGLRLVESPQTKYSFGSYFGYAIDSADFDQDGAKDLVIGAPFYSETFVEEGRVYIYFFDRNEQEFEEFPGLSLMEPSYRAQFGKSLVTGDFNADTFMDVIIGAPFENDGAGSIYVYNGKAGGLDQVYSQKIEGKNLEEGLKSFGSSFTRATDVDQNGYEDIGVGAYLSDSVYVFRSRPTFFVKASLILSESILNIEPNCMFNDRPVLCIYLSLTLTVPVQIKSKMEYELHLIMDRSKSVGEKRTYLSNHEHQVKETVTMQSDFFRKTYQVFIKRSLDIMSPIKFILHYNLKDQGYNSYCLPLCPISKNGTIIRTLKFNLHCGSDEICQTRLQVSLEISPKKIVLGRNKRVKATVKVFNLGEHAYNAKARIFFSPVLDFESVTKATNSSVECTSANKIELSCFLGNPMKEKDSVAFSLNFLLGSGYKIFEAFVAVNASTDSQVEPKYLMNTVNSSIQFYKEVHLEMTASSEPDTLVYKENYELMTAKHVYYLTNNGPSHAFDLVFSMDIPEVIIGGSNLMSIEKYGVYDGYRSLANVALNDTVCRLINFMKAGNKFDLSSLIKHGNIMNCSWLPCHRVVCEMKELSVMNARVFELEVKINAKILKQLQTKLRVFDVVSNGSLALATKKPLIRVYNDQSKATTSFIISRLKKKIQWWIVVCSIIIGIIFLIIVGLILWKCGFFRRVRVSPEDRKSLRVPNNENEGNANIEQEEDGEEDKED